ncbi:MAG: hypothetical protein EP330_25745 [Deltaproteobacteria bacterium]|nr:MAG: hypothetical protein EP330_25745 [Deltaproteobacteria bacterium]
MSVVDTLSGKHVLLTGATGFLAKVWLAQVLWHVPRIGRVTLLVRDKGKISAAERIADILGSSPAFRPLRERHGKDWGRFAAERIAVVRAELSEPGCGIDPEELDFLRHSVDLTVHSAGLTDFMPDPMAALRANVDATLELASVVASFDSPRLVHVSTCFVAGRVDGTIPEILPGAMAPNGSPLDPKAEVEALRAACSEGNAAKRARARIDIGKERAEALGFPNIYTYTKSLAERLLQHRADLEFAIVRPSVVECAWRFPFPGWNEGINTAGPVSWLIASPFRSLPSVEHHHFDVVPVDLIGRGLSLVGAALIQGRAEKLYQLGSSGINPMSFGRCIELNGLAVRKDTRKGGKDAWLRHLDPVPAPVDDKALFTVGRARNAADWLKKRIRSARPEDEWSEPAREMLGPLLDDLRSRMSTRLADTSRQLRRIDALLELFQPFTHDHDWVFLSDHALLLTEALPEEEHAAFAFDIADLDWRAYWIDVEYPGLKKWCFPLISGGTVPDDPPHTPAVVLGAPTHTLSRTA